MAKRVLGEKCKKCGIGVYREQSIQDDIQGMCGCDFCGHRIEQWQDDNLDKDYKKRQKLRDYLSNLSIEELAYVRNYSEQLLKLI